MQKGAVGVDMGQEPGWPETLQRWGPGSNRKGLWVARFPGTLLLGSWPGQLHCFISYTAGKGKRLHNCARASGARDLNRVLPGVLILVCVVVANYDMEKQAQRASRHQQVLFGAAECQRCINEGSTLYSWCTCQSNNEGNSYLSTFGWVEGVTLAANPGWPNCARGWQRHSSLGSNDTCMQKENIMAENAIGVMQAAIPGRLSCARGLEYNDMYMQWQ
eukprot:1156156-Pelagomonas_calceolata.AAC.8